MGVLRIFPNKFNFVSLAKWQVLLTVLLKRKTYYGAIIIAYANWNINSEREFFFMQVPKIQFSKNWPHYPGYPTTTLEKTILLGCIAKLGYYVLK